MNALLLAALSVIMFGLGLTLTLADFTRILRHPRVALIVLGCQILLLPVACFLLVTLLELGPALAVGMMLLAASPGGTSANLYSHVAGGDVALNVTLTAVNILLAPITLPAVRRRRPRTRRAHCRRRRARSRAHRTAERGGRSRRPASAGVGP